MADSRCLVFIATVYNDAKDITALRKKTTDIFFTTHIAGIRKGSYVTSISYAALKEAVAHISGKNVKMIYLIGTACYNRNKPIFATT